MDIKCPVCKKCPDMKCSECPKCPDVKCPNLTTKCLDIKASNINLVCNGQSVKVNGTELQKAFEDMQDAQAPEHQVNKDGYILRFIKWLFTSKPKPVLLEKTDNNASAPLMPTPKPLLEKAGTIILGVCPKGYYNLKNVADLCQWCYLDKEEQE